MISLDSLLWSKLKHAYGSAGDVPAMLSTVMESPYLPVPETVREVWFELWSSLCHQGNIYSASVAAVPHLCWSARTSHSGVLTPDFIDLPVAIEKARMRHPEQLHGVEVPDDYWSAILSLQPLIDSERLRENLETRQALSRLQRLFRGRHGASLPPQASDLGPLFTA